MRLIDADALKFDRIRIFHDCTGSPGGYHAVVMSSAIKDAPTIDAVPVIRCKDCKHWHQYLQECKWTGTTMAAEDYCSEAERKEEEEHE